jgi:hypothetical protein
MPPAPTSTTRARASTSERATTPGSTPAPGVVARTGPGGRPARSPGSMADPPRGRRVGRTPTTDLPKQRYRRCRRYVNVATEPRWAVSKASGPGGLLPRGRNPDRAEGLQTTRSTGPTATRGEGHRPLKNAIDAAGVTCKQANTPGRGGPNGRGRSRPMAPVALERALMGSQGLRWRAAPGQAGRGWRPAGRPHPSHGRCRSRA